MAGLLGKLEWYLNRLRAMSVPELGHRLREAGKRRVSAMRPYHGARVGVAAGDLPFLPVDTTRLHLTDETTRTLWRSVAPSATAPGIYRALGHDFRLSKDIDWHLDPASGLRWPDDAYCFDIDYRHDQKRGDVKLVWELNRLQFVPVMAALSRLENDDDLAQTALDMIESWIDANPPFKGVNWVSGIELALRVVAILLAVGLIGRNRIDARLSGKIANCLSAHAYWLKRYPSRYSSANNHLIAEEAALFILGTLWPEAAIDASAAKDVLTAEALNQIHDDGVGAEQSPTYTAFTCEWYLLAFAVAHQAGTPFPDDVIARIATAGEHLRWILDGEGHHPRIGDDDEGRVIASGAGHEPGYVASVLNGISALAGRPDIAVGEGRCQLRNLVLGWPATGSALNSGTRLFESGGYTVSRGEMNGREALVVFDHGPLGYLSIAAHGHADALSLMLHLGSKPVFVDAGTYLYHSGGRVRDRLRGTAAHNTLCINGENQSEIAGAFNWRRKAASKLLALQAAGQGVVVSAQHDGYARDYGLICERSVNIDAAGLVVTDRLLATDKADPKPLTSLSLGFLLHPECSAFIDGGAVVVERSGDILIKMSCEPNVTAALEDAEYSPAFGVMEKATRVVFHANDMTSREFQTRIEVQPLASSDAGFSPSLQPHQAQMPILTDAVFR